MFNWIPPAKMFKYNCSELRTVIGLYGIWKTIASTKLFRNSLVIADVYFLHLHIPGHLKIYIPRLCNMIGLTFLQILYVVLTIGYWSWTTVEILLVTSFYKLLNIQFKIQHCSGTVNSDSLSAGKHIVNYRINVWYFVTSSHTYFISFLWSHYFFIFMINSPVSDLIFISSSVTCNTRTASIIIHFQLIYESWIGSPNSGVMFREQMHNIEIVNQ